MASTPFLKPAVLQKVIPALNQGEVTFTRKDGKTPNDAPIELDADGNVIEQPADAPSAAKWKTHALFSFNKSALVNGQWQRVTRLTIPVPPSYQIQHQDIVTWTGFKGRVVSITPMGVADRPGGFVIEVAG